MAATIADMRMQNAILPRIARDWPGKSRPAIHPAVWHMLDVGAVAQALCVRHSPTGKVAQDAALCCLVALHDLGKISASFRAALTHGEGQNWWHWQHSAVLLAHHDELLGGIIGGASRLRRDLVEAVAGHHGGPRLPHEHIAQQMHTIGEQAVQDAGQVITAIGSLFPDASLDGGLPFGLPWLLNGLTVQADWIGSDVDWFPPQPPDIPLSEYWAQAQQQAERAIDGVGLHRARPAGNGAQHVLDPAFAPRPMQAEALSTPLPDGPTLTVIEDATGAGKTEAALILAARMMAKGKGGGLFFALPTMATANAMLIRLEATAPALFDAPPTLALSHGRASQSSVFRRIRARWDGSNPESGAHCGPWLSEDRRRVLLADVGIGTIDQALLSVLPTRFNALRLRALSQRILIVDEAHSYDPYMQAQLERLLMMQARLGGSAIIMTATLPAQMKQDFVTAFSTGLRDRPPRAQRHSSPSLETGPYPALTMVGGDTKLTAVNPAPATVRSVVVHRLADPAQAIELVRAATVKGAASIWIRNAVDDAIAAVDALRKVGIAVDLLHARFALCDRLRHETALQARFGRAGDGRAGRVLVATQVAEQSLDLDFDVMISDIAPISSLIQRAGRLWRHMDVRPERPVDGPALHVLSPDPDEVPDARWIHQVLDKGAFVYPPADLWRSARALFDAGEIRAPEGLRGLIEAVEGADAPPVPEALEAAEFEQEGKALVEGQLARGCLINPFDPFHQDAMQKVWDDEKFPTRLGVPQVTLALAVERDGALHPYGDDWHLSELQVSRIKFGEPEAFDQSDSRIKAIKAGWPRGRAEHTLIAPLDPEGRISVGLRYDAELGAIWGADED